MPTGVKIERAAWHTLFAVLASLLVLNMTMLTFLMVNPPADRMVNEYVGPERTAKASEYHQP